MCKMQEKIQTFNWEGINAQGKRMRGKFTGIQSMMENELQKQNIIPIKIQKKIKIMRPHSSQIQRKEISLFSRHLATLLTEGISLAKAIEIIANNENKASPMLIFLHQVYQSISAGKSFHDSLIPYQKQCGVLFMQVIHAGEKSGTLSASLEQLADYLEKMQIFRNNIHKALLYPAVILTSSSIISILLLIYVVPKFENLYQSFGSNLPFITQTVIQISRTLKNHFYLILSVLSCLFGTVRYLLNTSEKLTNLLDSKKLQLPFFGEIKKKYIISNFARMLSTSISSGIPLLEALSTTSKLTDNLFYRNSILQIQNDLVSGLEMHRAMSSTELFPKLVVQLIAIGEQSGTLDKMLNKIAWFYENEVEMSLNALVSLLEPILMLILALIIGGFVLALYLPIFSFGSII